ncbi:hypothetical protein ABOM_011406 [Aspergillus bombycis]|uniref:NAD(P)-binding domain-containing protein n=1 Tax=Aspergillus bombycis TaxID=109264 RepID=A0A1F7ZKU7_9EURO|nr:hypothetical protein ABOM_011406 [Aspergillus bombycis]OGM40087.1 hypothetical protein ABOM_011406 [Aspergillus bombycis]
MARIKPGQICLLGATGRTGRGILQILLTENYSDWALHIYVRSRAKLLSFFPGIEAFTGVKIFEGSITDVELWRQCFSGADIIISALGENENIAGLRLLQDAANTTVSALQVLSQEDSSNWRRPRLILLSSDTLNPTVAAARPRLVHWVVSNAFCYAYDDLRKAQAVYEAHPQLLRLCLVQPPALVEEGSSGHIIGTERGSLAVSYADLAAGFVEIAISDGYRNSSAVIVSSASKDRLRHVPELTRRIVRGTLARYIPWYLAVEEKMLGSAYLLGYPSEKVIKMYQNDSSQLKSLNDILIRTGATKDNWRQFLGKKKYTAAYTTFFDQELANAQNGWKSLVNEYLFSSPQPLINGFVAVGYEFSNPQIAAEALSLGCTGRDPIHVYLDTQYPGTSTYKTTSAKKILHRVHTDTCFSNLFSIPDYVNLSITFAQAEHALLEHWNAWDIVDPVNQFRDVVDVEGLLLIESRNGDGELGVLRQFWLFVPYVYVAQLRPEIGDGGDVRGVELRGRDWGWVYERCLDGEFGEDVHVVKVVRAFRMLEEWKNERDGWCLRAAVSFVEGFRGWTGFGAGGGGY